MPWRIATLALALAAVAGVGTAYVATTGAPSPLAPHAPAPPPPTRAAVLSPASGSAPVPLPTRVARRLAAAASDPALGGGLAALVVDGTTGTVLFAHRPAASLPPASSAKLLTAVAALDSYGPAARLATGVVRYGHTLVLLGGGDVTMRATASHGYPPTATLADLARRTAAAIAGGGRGYRVRYDARAWRGPTTAAGWKPGYFTAGDVSRLSALEVDEGRQGPSPYLPRTAEPARQAAAVFARQLRADGVRIVGAPSPGPAPASALGVASVSSPSYAALVQRMLTDSDNDLAEALARRVALRSGLPPTFAGAAKAVLADVRRLGVPMRGVRLYDGSGLSRLDRVTPEALVAVLRLAAGQVPALQPIAAGLPIAGATGTLADRYRHPAAAVGAGVVRAKTGTLAGVNALAGEVVDADGRLLLFAFLTNRASDPAETEAALDRLAARLAGCGCGHA